MKKYNITALGELLIDYTPMAKSESGMQVFEQNPGGAPANVLACATKLGKSTAFIGKVGADMQGEFLHGILKNAEIETKGLVFDSTCYTTLAFVTLSETGERSFSFARKPGADTQLTKNEVDLDILGNTEIFHFGSVTMSENPSHDTNVYAAQYAKEKGVMVSFDPNYRSFLWDDLDNAKKTIRNVLKYVDILKISDEECELVTGESDPYKAIQILINNGISVVAVTLGAKGALIANKHDSRYVDGFKAPVVEDTTGAGDSFWGAMLYRISESGKKAQDLNIEELADFTRFANATASLCVRKRGAIPAMPNLIDILELIK